MVQVNVNVALLVAVVAGAGCAGSGGGAVVEAPAPVGDDAVLRLLSVEPRAGDSYAALGLSGANKPNGLEYRYRRDVPSGTPGRVPGRLDGLDIFIAEPTSDGGWLAMYKGPILDAWRNSEYRIALFGPAGERRWVLDPARYFSRATHLEIQDLRYDGALYFNEGCITYARDAGGRCSALVKVDPVTGREIWRTPDRTSNGIFILHGAHVIAGYGFTAEPDSLFLVSRRTGRVVARHALDTAHAYLEVQGDDLVVVTREKVYRFRVEAAPRAGAG